MATNKPPAFGQHLRRYRRAAGLTQSELAGRAGLSLRGVQDLELGARRVPRLDTAQRLVVALGLAEADRSALLAARRPGPVPAANRWASPLAAAPAEVRPSATGDRLPESPSGFVGRKQEVAHLSRMLRQTCLLTMTGAGGVGKTRLALEVARESAFDFAWA